jgi:hypothetical protein
MDTCFILKSRVKVERHIIMRFVLIEFEVDYYGKLENIIASRI